MGLKVGWGWDVKILGWKSHNNNNMMMIRGLREVTWNKHCIQNWRDENEDLFWRGRCHYFDSHHSPSSPSSHFWTKQASRQIQSAAKNMLTVDVTLRCGHCPRHFLKPTQTFLTDRYSHLSKVTSLKEIHVREEETSTGVSLAQCSMHAKWNET